MVVRVTSGQEGVHAAPDMGVRTKRGKEGMCHGGCNGVAQCEVKRTLCGLAWGVSAQGGEEGAHTEGTEQLRNNHMQGH